MTNGIQNNFDFFQIVNYADIFRKIEYQIENFNSTSCEQNDIYLLWDVILSLNHLLEWIANDKFVSKECKIQCLNDFYPYKDVDKNHLQIPAELFDIIKSIGIKKINRQQIIIREIANGLKHFSLKINIYSEIKPKYLSETGNMSAGEPTSVAGYYENYKFLIELENESIDLIKLIHSLIAQWKIFLSKL